MSETLGLREAAAHLKTRPDTLAKECRAGRVPGAKPFGSWVFLKEDLDAFIRTKYQEEIPCLSKSAATYGTFTSRPRTAKLLESVLTRQTGKQRKSSTTT